MSLWTRIVCGVFNHHDWCLLEEYKPMVKALVFTGDGFEEKNIPSPFKKEHINGKWTCRKCKRVSIGTRHGRH